MNKHPLAGDALQRFNDGLHHALNGDAVHAAKINGAFAQETRLFLMVPSEQNSCQKIEMRPVQSLLKSLA